MIYPEQGRTEHAKVFNLKWKFEIIKSRMDYFFDFLNPFLKSRMFLRTSNTNLTQKSLLCFNQQYVCTLNSFLKLLQISWVKRNGIDVPFRPFFHGSLGHIINLSWGRPWKTSARGRGNGSINWQRVCVKKFAAIWRGVATIRKICRRILWTVVPKSGVSLESR